MKDSGISLDVVTFTCILKACGSVGSLSCGKHIHDDIMNEGYWGKIMILGNALIDMLKVTIFRKQEKYLMSFQLKMLSLEWYGGRIGSTRKGYRSIKLF